MKNLAVRVTLLGLFVVAAGVAAYLIREGQSRARVETRAARTFDVAAIDAQRQVMEVRAAQPAYLAPGQSDDYWGTKVTSTASALRNALNALRSASSSPQAQSALDSAVSTLDDFVQMDGRARGYLRTGQQLLASDLIFADSLEMTGGLLGQIEQARTAESQARQAAAAAIRRGELIAAASAAAVGLLVMIALTPGTAPRLEEPDDSVPAASRHSAEPLGLDLRIDMPNRGVQTTPPQVRVDLDAVASVCSDLSRLTDTHALPAILERTAGVLDAPGVILWIADPDGRELSPIVTQGYSPHLVARLGTIGRDAENATASAFRTSLLQTVDADSVSNGAIAAPLVTPAGCIGVMAAEVRNKGEKDSAKLAAATIVAAQLATLVGPPSTRAQARAAGA